jgi:hypothetical protein
MARNSEAEEARRRHGREVTGVEGEVVEQHLDGRGEEEGGVGRPWQLQAGVSLLAIGALVDSGSGHSTWLLVGDGLPVHSGGRAMGAAAKQRRSVSESRAEQRVRAARGGSEMVEGDLYLPTREDKATGNAGRTGTDERAPPGLKDFQIFKNNSKL